MPIATSNMEPSAPARAWTPEEQLALDEALLEAAEAGGAGEVLRFWEAPAPFVVLGYSNHAATEVNLPACAAAEVPVLRRASGGGTVLQGPGCLNYTLVLRCDRAGLHGIPSTNRTIMETHRAALQPLLAGRVAVQGHTDLTLDGCKFSGNAQRRKRAHLLFHGTFLLNFDLPSISRLLHSPAVQPAYRQSRPHGDFVTNTDLTVAAVRSALTAAWHDVAPAGAFPLESVARLVGEKYSRPEWNLKF